MKRVWILIVGLLIFSFAGCKAAPEKQETKPQNHQFEYNGVTIAVNAEAAPIIEALGEPQAYTEEPSCASDEMDKTYNYGSFYLTAYSKDGTDYISRIWFVDDGAVTQRGIHIGSSKEDVEQAYKTLLRDQCLYYSDCGNSSMTIIMENDVVTSIQYDLIFTDDVCSGTGNPSGCYGAGTPSSCYSTKMPSCACR